MAPAVLELPFRRILWSLLWTLSREATMAEISLFDCNYFINMENTSLVLLQDRLKVTRHRNWASLLGSNRSMRLALNTVIAPLTDKLGQRNCWWNVLRDLYRSKSCSEIRGPWFVRCIHNDTTGTGAVCRIDIRPTGEENSNFGLGTGSVIRLREVTMLVTLAFDCAYPRMGPGPAQSTQSYRIALSLQAQLVSCQPYCIFRIILLDLNVNRWKWKLRSIAIIQHKQTRPLGNVRLRAVWYRVGLLTRLRLQRLRRFNQIQPGYPLSKSEGVRLPLFALR